MRDGAVRVRSTAGTTCSLGVWPAPLTPRGAAARRRPPTAGFLPPLAGEWDAEFILHDEKQCSWVVCSLAYAGPTTLPLIEAYPPGRGASQCIITGPGGVREQHSAPPVRDERAQGPACTRSLPAARLQARFAGTFRDCGVRIPRCQPHPRPAGQGARVRRMWGRGRQQAQGVLCRRHCPQAVRPLPQHLLLLRSLPARALAHPQAAVQPRAAPGVTVHGPGAGPPTSRSHRACGWGDDRPGLAALEVLRRLVQLKEQKVCVLYIHAFLQSRTMEEA